MGIPSNIVRGTGMGTVQTFDNDGHPFDLKDGYYYTYSAGTADTVVLDGQGYISNLCIGTNTSANNVITIYDNNTASGDIVYKFSGIGAPTTVSLECYVSTGITISALQDTGATLDVTLTWRPFITTFV